MGGCVVGALLAVRWEPRLPLHSKSVVRRGAKKSGTEVMRSLSNRSYRAKSKQDLTRTNKRSGICSDLTPTQSKVEKAGVLKLVVEAEKRSLTTGTERHVKTLPRRESTAAHGPFVSHREACESEWTPLSAAPPLRPTLPFLGL